MIDEKVLSLETIPLHNIQITLSAKEMDWLERWKGLVGKKTGELLPYLRMWGKKHRQQILYIDHDNIAVSESGTHWARVGRPSLGNMLHIFESRPNVIRQCLIPHIKRTEENCIIEFQRGPAWRTRKKE